MGRLKSLTILLTLVSWGAATEGAPPPEDAATVVGPSLPPGVQAGDYVEAVVKLCNEGKQAQAGPYLQAAQQFRDQLSTEDQARLDQYTQMLAPAPAGGPGLENQAEPIAPAGGSDFGPQTGSAPGPAGAAPEAGTAPAAGSTRERAVALVAAARQAMAAGQFAQARGFAQQANALAVPFSPNEDSPAQVLADLERATVGGRMGRGAATTNPKQQATWLLHSAREQIQRGQFDQAAQYLAQAKALDVHWGLFDDTPSKVEKDLNKAMAEAPPTTAAGTVPGDRKQAKARLKEARAALDRGDTQHAKAIALEVNSWGLRFGLLEDNPHKILAACRALEHHDAIREAGPTVRTNEDIYNYLVTEARQLIAQGRYDEAAARARQAQSMPVVPSVAADRAEAVLHDLAMLQARGETGNAATASQPAAEPPPSAVAEREANQLLAQNQVEAARAKFEEAARLRAQEAGIPTGAVPIGLTPTPAASDAAVQKTDGTLASPGLPAEEAEAPGLAAPASEMPTPTLEPVGSPTAGQPAPADGQPAQAEAAIELEAVPTPGSDDMEQARALLAAGNYRATRQAAQQALDAGGGLEAENLLAQIAQTRQQAALQLYEAALASIRKNELERSRALLNELATSDLDAVMAQKVQDLLTKIPTDDAGQAEVGLGTVEDAEVVKAQQMNAEVGTKVAEARRLMETDPQKAIELLQQQLAAVNAAGLSEPVTHTMVRRLEVAIELAKKDKVAFDEKMKDKSYREEIERKRLRIIEADKAKKERVKEFLDKAMEAQANDNWVEAEKYARLAAEIAPNEIAATALATKARIMRHYERDKQTRLDKEESFLNVMQDVDALGNVSQDLIRRGIEMPSDFKELTENRRDLANRLAPNYKTVRELEIEKKLNESITLPKTDHLSLGEAIRYIGEYTGLNIVADQGALAEEGLTLDSPVTLSAVNNIKLKSVLKLMLSPLHLSYTIDEEVLLITSPQAKQRHMVTRVYSVADLVLSPHHKDNKNPLLSPSGSDLASSLIKATEGQGQDPNQLQAQANAMAGNNQPAMMGLNAAGGFGTQTSSRPKPEFEPLIRLITSSIAPGTWGRNDLALEEMDAYGQGANLGGEEEEPQEGVGSITPFYLNISLIIRQTPEIHDEIVDLLRQLRRLQDLQVSIEVRFINVSDSFFEQIGVDFDFAIQSDAVGRHSSLFVPNPAAANQTTGSTTGSTGTTSGGTTVSPYLVNPAARDHGIGRAPLIVGTNTPGGNDPAQGPASILGANPGLVLPFSQSTLGQALTLTNAPAGLGGTFGIAFLSDLEVYLFMQAMQGDVRSNLVQAPKVTSFNGAPAMVFNFTGHNYVASLSPIIGAGAVAFQPQVSTFPDGVTLSVTPVVSADRRYVRLTLSPMFTTFLGFDVFQIPAAVGGGGLGGQASSITGQIQLPQFSITMISTTVTVPDGGTVLLGGVKRLREQRQEFGVPVLSKTPLIDRLFRNIGIGRTTESLMLMVTPRIIILEEEEERLGIPAIQTTF